MHLRPRRLDNDSCTLHVASVGYALWRLSSKFRKKSDPTYSLLPIPFESPPPSVYNSSRNANKAAREPTLTTSGYKYKVYKVMMYIYYISIEIVYTLYIYIIYMSEFES